MRWFLSRPVVLPLLGILILATTVLYARAAHAQPIAVARAENGSVTLHKAPCELKTVSNLPYKAVWVQDGKTYEGCWGQHPGGLLLAYFDDLSVVLMHPQQFQPLSSM